MASTIVDTDLLIRNWWVILLRGIAAIMFGILTLFAPAMSLMALVLLFGAYALTDGILLLVSALRNRNGTTPRWALVFQGLAGIAAGVVTALWPGISANAVHFRVGRFRA